MDRQEYIEYLLDHFENPRNRHRMEDADVQLGGGNPGCGDLITMYLKVDDDQRITDASFVGEGCTISQAGGSIISEMIVGMTTAEVRELGAKTMMEEMGEDVVKSRVRCATLAIGTVQAAITALEQDKRRTLHGLEPENRVVTEFSN
ncbi:MAG: iron-sulfur cluster assembly scaffold protein [Thermomicrobiales bacterium]